MVTGQTPSVRTAGCDTEETASNPFLSSVTEARARDKNHSVSLDAEPAGYSSALAPITRLRTGEIIFNAAVSGPRVA